MDSDNNPEVKTVFDCTICLGQFDIECEGGVTGDLGILPVSLCPTCYAGLDEFFTELHGCHNDEEQGR